LETPLGKQIDKKLP